MSGTSPGRPSGCPSTKAASISGLSNAAAVVAVRVMPGCTEFTRMPYSPSSLAATRTSWSTAAFPALYEARYRAENTAAVDEMADERSRAVADHGQTGVLEEELNGPDVGIDGGAERIVIGQQHGSDHPCARHHNGDVEAPFVVACGEHRLPHVGGIAGVATHGEEVESVGAGLVGCCLQSGLGATADGHDGAVGGQGASGAEPYARTAADDDGPLAGECAAHAGRLVASPNRLILVTAASGWLRVGGRPTVGVARLVHLNPPASITAPALQESGRFGVTREQPVGAFDQSAEGGVVVVGDGTEPDDSEAGEGGGEPRPRELGADRSGETGLRN